MRKIGNIYEVLAQQHLINQGLAIITTNYVAHRIGEIDIIAKDKDTLVFVEVKARKRSKFGSSIESVTPSKQRKIINTASHFLQHHPQYASMDCRFDVIGFDVKHQISESHQTNHENYPKIHWIKNAFLVE